MPHLTVKSDNASSPAPEALSDVSVAGTPPVPANCDLRGMPFLPIDIVRLFDSDFYALSTGEEFKAALTLWGKSFLQVPAASLPNDDRILASLSCVGLKRWPKVREMALRGFVLCSDGRLYHHVVAEKALAAWNGRQAQRARTEAARAARAVSRSTATSSVTDNVTGSKGKGKGEGKGEGKGHTPRAVVTAMDLFQVLKGKVDIFLRDPQAKEDAEAKANALIEAYAGQGGIRFVIDAIQITYEATKRPLKPYQFADACTAHAERIKPKITSPDRMPPMPGALEQLAKWQAEQARKQGQPVKAKP